MIATDFKLIPLSMLHKHQAAVLRGLDTLPFSYAKNLLDEPEIRYAFLYYALLTHWPELLNGISAEDLLYNRLYWFLRMSRQYEAGYEHHAAALFESARRELGVETVRDVETKVRLELKTKKMEIAVSFSSFSIGKVKDELGVQLEEAGDFFVLWRPSP